MWKQFTEQGNYNRSILLPKLYKDYNNTKHSNIGRKLVEVNKDNEQLYQQNI